MTDSEVSPENQCLNDHDDVDIYSDVLCDQDSLKIQLKEKVDKLSKEKELLLRSLNSLQKNYEDLRKEYEILKEKFNVVSFNSSALFKTAQAEVKRKDKLINELRKEKDDLVFRKVCVNQALQKSRRCAALSPKKYRSPIKKQNIILRTNIKEPTKTPNEEPFGKLRYPNSKSTESSEELLVSKDTLEANDLEGLKPCKISVEHVESYQENKKTSERISSFKESSIVLKEENQASAKLLDDQNYSSSKCKITKVNPPPLHGPVTAYSKRQYKKIHGVSPPKEEIKSVKKGNLPKDTISKLNHTSKETEINERDNKLESITAKLQKDVQQIIKLGSPSKSSSSSTTKLSPEKQNQYNSPIKDGIAKQTSSKPIVEKLIIHCDLRSSLEDNPHNLTNSVSLNETIGNILKKQKAYSPKSNFNANVVCKDEELEKQNCFNDLTSKTAGKVLPNLNKKVTDKPKISPATFGNLVPHPVNSRVNVTLSKETDLCKDRSTDRTCSLQKRKLSESLKREVSPQAKRKRIHKYVNKMDSLSSLFGESPVKCENAQIEVVESGPTHNPIKHRNNSSLEKTTYTSSPKFSDSPSVDSDNDESLVIDTSYCSQKTSPRVSESDKNNIIEIEGGSEVKNIDTNNESELMQFQSDAGSKEPAVHLKQNIPICTQDETHHSMNSDEVPNNLIANKTTNDAKENLISPLQLATNNLNTHSKENIPTCQPLNNIDQNKLSTPNNNYQYKDREDLLVETSHLSGSLDKVVSPEKTSESQNQLLSDDTITVSKNISEDKAGPRFIPSPPPLTMVSAFKHSENSVFALAEDTIGFVRILTRMRDLSPIRTPDKNNKSLKSSLSQYQQMDATGLDHADTEVSNKISFEFIKPLNQDPKTKNNSLSLVPVLNRADNLSPKCKKVNTLSTSTILAQSCEMTQFEASEKQTTVETTNKCSTKQSESIQSVCNQSKAQKRDLEQGNKEEISNTNKSINDNGNNKKTAQSQKHPFRRRNPVKRITSEQMSELKPLGNERSNTPEKNQEHSSKQQNSEKEVSSQLSNNDLVNQSPNTRIVPDMTVNKANSINEKNVDKKTVDKMKKIKQDMKLVDTTKNSGSARSKSSDLNDCPTKGVELTGHDIAKVKIFKRSESLKMAQKPLPRNYINVMKNNEGKTHEDLFRNTSASTKKMDSGDLVSKKVEIPKKPDPSIDLNKVSEMNQVSHIASINKKLRVSKYQNNSKNDNFIQPNVSENLMTPNKDLNFLMNMKKFDPKTKNDNGKCDKKEKENLSKINQHSTSMNMSSKERKRHHRRSVSLGPEIRLGIHINLPLNRKNKEAVSASHFKYNNSRLSPPIQDINESISVKSSDTARENPTKNCEDENESLQREIPDKMSSGTLKSFNFKSERNLDSQLKRSKSTNSRRHTPQNCYTQSKSPDSNINASGLRKSRSKSPIALKRSKSNHRVPPKKSPDFERKNYHKIQRTRSPESSLSKFSHEHCSGRSYSSGKRRHSRYEQYHRRSPSPEQRHHKRRSSRYKCRYKIDRSNSKSPEQSHKNFKLRKMEKGNLMKSSVSYLQRSPDKSLRNSSFSRHDLDNNSLNNLYQNHSHDMKKKCIANVGGGEVDKGAEKNAILSYEQEFERMRKEIEKLKSQVSSKNDRIAPDNSLKHDEKELQLLQCQSGNNSLKHDEKETQILHCQSGNNSLKHDKKETQILQCQSGNNSLKNDEKELQILQCQSGNNSLKNDEKESQILQCQSGSYIELEQNNKREEQSLRNRSPEQEKVNFNIVTGVENVEERQMNLEEPQHRSHIGKRNSTENTQNLNQLFHDIKGSAHLSLEKPKPIQVKRRTRTLGDSEVNVVSIK